MELTGLQGFIGAYTAGDLVNLYGACCGPRAFQGSVKTQLFDLSITV